MARARSISPARTAALTCPRRRRRPTIAADREPFLCARRLVLGAEDAQLDVPPERWRSPPPRHLDSRSGTPVGWRGGRRRPAPVRTSRVSPRGSSLGSRTSNTPRTVPVRAVRDQHRTHRRGRVLETACQVHRVTHRRVLGSWSRRYPPAPRPRRHCRPAWRGGDPSGLTEAGQCVLQGQPPLGPLALTSSSWDGVRSPTGAMTASPMCLSTRPPNPTTTASNRAQRVVHQPCEDLRVEASRTAR